MDAIEAREQWLDHGLSDIDYIRILEKRIGELEAMQSCVGCRWDFEFSLGKTPRDRAIHVATCNNCSRYISDKYELKDSE